MTYTTHHTTQHITRGRPFLFFSEEGKGEGRKEDWVTNLCICIFEIPRYGVRKGRPRVAKTERMKGNPRAIGVSGTWPDWQRRGRVLSIERRREVQKCFWR